MEHNASNSNLATACVSAMALVITLGACTNAPSQPSATPTTAATPAAEAARPAIAVKKNALGDADYSPFVEPKLPARVYWGVAHVHTGYSFDSGMFGVTLTPDDLFRVATGGEVVVDNGVRFKQDRPLDWVSITDHAEYMGISDQIRAGSPELLANPQGKRWYEMSKTSPQEGVKAAIEAVVSMQTGKPVFDASKLTAAAWAHATAAAEKWNQPGVFTTLHGFEWTSAPGGNNLHRTVIFRDGADRVKQVVPFSTFDSQDPAELWKYMDAYAKKTGGQVLAIPHNGNLSNGMMYLGGDLRRKAHGPGLRRGARQPRAADGGDADQGRQRDPSLPLAERRVRRISSDGGTSMFGKMEPADEQRASRQLRPLGAQAGTGTGRQARSQPLQVRPDRRQRCPHRRGHHAGRQLLR